MCGIVGGISERNISSILLEGLRRLEYRGYDSAGIALVTQNAENNDHILQRVRAEGKLSILQEKLTQSPIVGQLGIAHTRWATHGIPVERNAHPHISSERIALVHNGIVENYLDFKPMLIDAGYCFTSETDSEVMAHLIAYYLSQPQYTDDLLGAVQAVTQQLTGAYSIAVIDRCQADRLVVARQGTPLVVGIGFGEHFVASDSFALLPVTQRIIYLEDGDIAQLSCEQCRIVNSTGQVVERPIVQSQLQEDAADRGPFRHYMQKEIFAQPQAISDTLEGRMGHELATIFGLHAAARFAEIQQVHIVACGTSFHAGLIAKYWLEQLGIVTCVEVASEYRYRSVVTPPGTLFVGLSQSGETLDTLEALKIAKKRGIHTSLALCNVPESALIRESDLCFLTRAGREIGVASTKAFTTQLVGLRLLALALVQQRQPDYAVEQAIEALRQLPRLIESVLQLDHAISQMAIDFADKNHALFLGRGMQYPVALEGALKLKEISYIHAEAYPAGELKHGPLALVDADMPVIAMLPDDCLLEKVLGNLQEVRARGGQLYVFADANVAIPADAEVKCIRLPLTPESVAPIVYTIPLQLLAYHVAVIKGTDVDQPRNLAKSVTVE